MTTEFKSGRTNESATHEFIKNKIAESLSELGYDTKTEVVTREGRLDVHAVKDGNEINVEVYKTHIPEWIVAKINGSIPEIEKTRKPYKPRKSKPNGWGVFLRNRLIGMGQHDGSILCWFCFMENVSETTRKMYTNSEIAEHVLLDHQPIQWDKLVRKSGSLN